MNTKLLNYSKISRDVGVSADTIKKYFSILEDTHLEFRLLPYHRSLRKRQVKSPKFYFFDRGVVRTKDGAKIDLVVEKPEFKDLILVEIKSSKFVRSEDGNTTRAFLKDLPTSKGYCLSLNVVSKQIKRVKFLHW